MFFSSKSRNTFGILAVAGGLFLIMHGLTAPFLLFVALVYSMGTIANFIELRKVDRFCLAISGISLCLFLGVFFVPLWVAEFFADTAVEHISLAERYASRGQIFANDNQVLKHYLVAAKSGNAEAQARLGEAYFFGHYGLPISRSEALRWLKAASDQGNKSAKHTLTFIQSNP